MTTSSVSSPSHSLRSDPTKSKRRHTLPLHKSEPSERRWPRSSNAKPAPALSHNSHPSSSLKLLAVRSRRLPKASTRFRMFILERWNCSRRPSSVCISLPMVVFSLLILFADLGALLALHGESNTTDDGKKLEREFKEQTLESVWMGNWLCWLLHMENYRFLLDVIKRAYNWFSKWKINLIRPPVQLWTIRELTSLNVRESQSDISVWCNRSGLFGVLITYLYIKTCIWLGYLLVTALKA
jgi:hypothetical protein